MWLDNRITYSQFNGTYVSRTNGYGTAARSPFSRRRAIPLLNADCFGSRLVAP